MTIISDKSHYKLLAPFLSSRNNLVPILGNRFLKQKIVWIMNVLIIEENGTGVGFMRKDSMGSD
jgi:hypothetical protein